MDLVTLPEVAQRHDRTKAAVYQWRGGHSDFPPPTKMVGRVALYDYDAVDEWAKTHRVGRHYVPVWGGGA